MPPPDPPPLDAPALRRSAPAWVAVEVTAASPSTHTDVVARARAGAPHGLVVVTEHQTAGRGRLDRVWLTPPRTALTFSVLLRPWAPASRWSWLPLLAGLAVLAGVRREVRLACALKWPNDVLAGERKLAGILAERVETPAGPAAVVGVGLNVALDAEQLPVPSATSLLLEGVAAVDRTGLLVALLEALGTAYERVGAGADLREEYVAHCATLGRGVRVELPGGRELLGRAVGIDPGGRLEVLTDAGRRLLGAGDVVHVRVP